MNQMAFDTSAKVKDPRRYNKWEMNFASVWGLTVPETAGGDNEYHGSACNE